jgi:hypothetical protein
MNASSKMIRMKLSYALLIGTTLALSTRAQPASQSGGVKITEQPDRLRVEINGQPFTEYFFKDVPRPFCYPLLGPGGLPMTQLANEGDRAKNTITNITDRCGSRTARSAALISGARTRTSGRLPMKDSRKSVPVMRV